MITRVCAKHPCTQLVYLQGVAVGRVERYRCEEPTANPCEFLFHAQECYCQAIVNKCYSLIHFTGLYSFFC